MSRLDLSIANVTISVVCDALSPELRVFPPMERFVCEPPNRAEIELSVKWIEIDPEPPGALAFDSGALWKMFRGEDGQQVFDFVSPAFGSTPYRRVRFAPDFSRGEIELDPRLLPTDQPLYPLDYPLDEIVMSNLLARGRGLETHACGILTRDERGLLFLGHSGAGKSTIAKLLLSVEGVEILSDDRIVIREQEGDLTMFGTPWHGEAALSTNGFARLNGIFLLRHADENRITRIDPATCAGELLTRSFVPFYAPEVLPWTIDFAATIARKSESSVLEFRPDESVIEALGLHIESLES